MSSYLPQASKQVFIDCTHRYPARPDFYLAAASLANTSSDFSGINATNFSMMFDAWRNLQPIVTRYCSVMRVQDGKVVEGRDYYDSASIARQLGLVD